MKVSSFFYKVYDLGGEREKEYLGENPILFIFLGCTAQLNAPTEVLLCNEYEQVHKTTIPK